MKDEAEGEVGSGDMVASIRGWSELHLCTLVAICSKESRVCKEVVDGFLGLTALL